ncbi:MAG: hypothetical protein DWQ19_11365 [Crenarchaeota archaeon]|nr:MAG: hypothetical protein DWQ19_11365 [Thermoproteota archaeon]
MNEVHPVNCSKESCLLENGMIVQRFDNDKWYLRRYSPSEEMDSKWDVWLNDSQCWGAAVCLCFVGREESGFVTAKEAIEASKNLKERKRSTEPAKLLTQKELEEWVNSEEFKKTRDELREKVSAIENEYLSKGYTHKGWVTGEGGDSVYLKESEDHWTGSNGIIYKKSTGVAMVVSELTHFFQLDLTSIASID